MEEQFAALAERVAAEKLPAVMAAVTDVGERGVNIRIVSTAKSSEILIALLYTLIKSVARENNLEPLAFLKKLEPAFAMEES